VAAPLETMEPPSRDSVAEAVVLMGIWDPDLGDQDVDLLHRLLFGPAIPRG